jgi:choline dehydrogenase-like flavoprotein
MRRWEFRDVWPDSVRSCLLDKGGYERAENELWKTAPTRFEERLCGHLASVLGPDFSVTALPRSLHAPSGISESGQRLGPEKARGVFSTADTLLDSTGFPGATGSAYLAVNLDHLGVHLETDGDRVTTVVCEDLLGRVRRAYRGKVVVLACGSLESPRLALNSGLRDPKGRIGVGLTDHPAWFSEIHPELPREGALGWLGDRAGHGKVLIQQGTSETGERPFNVELLVNPMYWDFRHSDDEVARQLAEERGPSKLEVKFIFDSPLEDGNWVRSRGVGQKLDLFVRPNETARSFLDEIAGLRSKLFSALDVPVPEAKSWWRLGNEGTVHHAGGTLRMSDNHSGVVDECLRFESYSNLYACDVSVFPSIPAANPSLTRVALALRLADHLVDVMG